MGSFRYVWDTALSIYKSLFCVFQAQAGYFCWKDSSLKFLEELHIKKTILLFSKAYFAVTSIFY